MPGYRAGRNTSPTSPVVAISLAGSQNRSRGNFGRVAHDGVDLVVARPRCTCPGRTPPAPGRSGRRRPAAPSNGSPLNDPVIGGRGGVGPGEQVGCLCGVAGPQPVVGLQPQGDVFGGRVHDGRAGAGGEEGAAGGGGVQARGGTDSVATARPGVLGRRQGVQLAAGAGLVPGVARPTRTGTAACRRRPGKPSLPPTGRPGPGCSRPAAEQVGGGVHGPPPGRGTGCRLRCTKPPRGGGAAAGSGGWQTGLRSWRSS